MVTDDTSDENGTGEHVTIPFPHSRTTPAGTAGGYKDLGIGAMARHLGMTKGQLTGHWCSRCKGMWFGYALEVECPQCGNRHG